MTKENKIKNDTAKLKKEIEEKTKLGLGISKIFGFHFEKTSTGEEFLANKKGEKLSENEIMNIYNSILNIICSRPFIETKIKQDIEKKIEDEDNGGLHVFAQTTIGKENFENEKEDIKDSEIFDLEIYDKK